MRYLDVLASDLQIVSVLGVLVGWVNEHQIGELVLIGSNVLGQSREESEAVVGLGEGEFHSNHYERDITTYP